MHLQRRLAASCRAAVALLALLLAGCGGAGPPSAGDAAAVRRDVAKALTTAGRDICELRRYATQRFVEQDSFSIPELVKVNAETCRADVDGFAADAVKLSHVKVDGDRATARLVARGGALGYGVLDLDLVRDGSWKLDRITAVDLDRRKFDELQRRFARLDDDPLPASVVACAKRRIARRSDAEIERAVVRGDSTLVSDPLLVCVVRPQLRRALPNDVTSCVVEQLGRDDDALLRIVLREDEDASQRLFRDAAEACAAGTGASTI
ncbi:MAG: hypothetical protein QOJ89_1680 [bacterium]|jgi:hypothetical protein